MLPLPVSACPPKSEVSSSNRSVCTAMPVSISLMITSYSGWPVDAFDVLDSRNDVLLLLLLLLLLRGNNCKSDRESTILSPFPLTSTSSSWSFLWRSSLLNVRIFPFITLPAVLSVIDDPLGLSGRYSAPAGREISTARRRNRERGAHIIWRKRASKSCGGEGAVAAALEVEVSIKEELL